MSKVVGFSGLSGLRVVVLAFLLAVGLGLLWHAPKAEAQTLSEGWSGYMSITVTSPNSGDSSEFEHKEKVTYFVNGQAPTYSGNGHWSQDVSWTASYYSRSQNEVGCSIVRNGSSNGTVSAPNDNFGWAAALIDIAPSWGGKMDYYLYAGPGSGAYYTTTTTNIGSADSCLNDTWEDEQWYRYALKSFNVGDQFHPDGKAATKLEGTYEHRFGDEYSDWVYEWHLTRLPDTDKDGIPNSEDNCKNAFNPEQDDSNGDGKGDVCQDDEGGDENTTGCPAGSFEYFDRYHRVEVPGVNQDIFQYGLSVPNCKGHPEITAQMMESNPPTATGQIIPSSWAQLLATRAASVYLPSIDYKYDDEGEDDDPALGVPAQVERGANGEFIVSSSHSLEACTSLPATKAIKIASKNRFVKAVIKKFGKHVSYKKFVKKIPRSWQERIVGVIMKPVLYKASGDTQKAIKKHVVNQIEDYVDGNFSACKTVWEPNMTAKIHPNSKAEMSEPSKPLLGLKSYSSTEPVTER